MRYGVLHDIARRIVAREVIDLTMGHANVIWQGDANAIALRCQIRIQPMRRTYTDQEAAGLLDMFGPRERWSATQQAFPWLHATSMVPGFTGTTRSTM